MCEEPNTKMPTVRNKIVIYSNSKSRKGLDIPPQKKLEINAFFSGKQAFKDLL